MMIARLALETEVEHIVAMAAANLAETKPGEPFEPDRVREVFFDYINEANPTIWVAEDKREIVGFCQGTMNRFDYKSGLFVAQKVLYVKPERRGSRAAAILMKALIEWARHLGASEVVGGNDNDFRSERTAGFLEHFGFRRVGFAMTLALGPRHGVEQVVSE